MSCHYFLVYSDILIISISTKISWNYFLNKCLVYLNLLKLRSTVNKITFFDRDDNYMYLKNLQNWKKSVVNRQTKIKITIDSSISNYLCWQRFRTWPTTSRASEQAMRVSLINKQRVLLPRPIFRSLHL